MVGMYFQINDWVLSVDENKLYRQDREVSVEPRLINLLLFLAQHVGEVFCREELIEHVWSGAIVTDQVVTQSIFELRKLLKDGREDNTHYVVTVPKRGYKLVANVESLERLPLGKGKASDVMHTTDYDEPVHGIGSPEMTFPAGPLTRAVCQKRRTGYFTLNSRGKHNALNALWISLLIAFIATFTYHQTGVKITQAIDAHLVEFQYQEGFNNSQLNHELADGITQKLMSDITQVSSYRVQLDKADFTSGILPGKTISVRVEDENGSEFLVVEYRNNSSEKVIFSRQYPLASQHLKVILRQVAVDLMKAMKIPQPEQKSTVLVTGLPNDAQALRLLIQANHYLNQSDVKQFKHGVDLLEQVVQIEPDNLYVQAELYISYFVAQALEPEQQLNQSRINALSQNLQASRSRLASPVQPRIYEALALDATLSNHMDLAKRYLDQALATRDSTLSYILLGKHAELMGDLDQASEAYSEAFYIDTAIETYMLCENLIFYTNLKSLDYALYRAVHPSVVHLL
ncbi:lysine decarboxylation/transport transcriptional activator CadC [Vibrio hepatarius]|uniref:lysine decarboxylation/transport transcriptional activator CadC n=1 Tax=Vibrio hepatarius TaxID=171383 RepID=UPI00373609AB